MFFAAGVGEVFKYGKVFPLNGRCIPKAHTPSAPLGDRVLTDAGFRCASYKILSCFFVSCPTANDTLDYRPVAGKLRSAEQIRATDCLPSEQL